MPIALLVLIFCIGPPIGFLIGYWLRLDRSYAGTILVSEDEDKLIYSLELSDDPEKLQYKKEVLFKVTYSEVSLDRK